MPNNPINGAADAIVAKALRYFSSRCATRRPVPSIVARKSASLQRGFEFSARKPLASTSPNAELRSSCATMSVEGMPLRETVITSSSRRAGATLLLFRLRNRSITRASASTEQATSGQIGQPAACMIESKEDLRADRNGLAIMAYGRATPAVAPANPLGSSCPVSPTESVDNFVENRGKKCPQARLARLRLELMEIRAVKIAMKSTVYYVTTGASPACGRFGQLGPALWSNCSRNPREWRTRPGGRVAHG